jgi:Fungal protein kinase
MGILHRDISMNNIMFRRNGAQVVGVLIDYDLSIDINNPSHRSLEQTGVRRFMAIDLLEDTPMPHHARHDMESMFWVLVWFTFRYQGGDEILPIESRPLEEWFTDDKLHRSKRSFFNKMEGAPTRPFSSLRKLWISPLTLLFTTAHLHLGNYNQSVVEWGKYDHDPGPKTEDTPDEPIFDRGAVFYDDKSMWIALWEVLKPMNPIEFDDVSNSTRLGFMSQGWT